MKTHSTTIVSVRHRGVVAMGGDGQVTVANTIMKADVNKLRRLMDGRVMTGFAGATADAFALLERFEAKLKDYPSNVPRAATELAKEWRTDRVLRRLEAMMLVVDAKHTLLLTGNGDVVQPSDGIMGIGSGGNYAVAAARAWSPTATSRPSRSSASRWKSPLASTFLRIRTSWWRKWRARSKAVRTTGVGWDKRSAVPPTVFHLFATNDHGTADSSIL